MTNLLDEALGYYKEQRLAGRALNTRIASETQLERWRNWMVKEIQENVYLSDVDTITMSRYFNRLRPRVEPSSFNAYRQIVDAFWTYCVKEGWVSTNPVRNVDRQKVPRRTRLQLSPSEWITMLELTPDPRDRILLAVALNTALRASDIVTLRIGDIDLVSLTLNTLIRKTSGEDSLPISSELRAELLAWYQAYADKMNLPDIASIPNTWRLIPAYEKGPRQYTTLCPLAKNPMTKPHLIVHAALERIGHSTEREGMHTLRRTAGRVLFDLLIARGVNDPIRIIQALFNHKSRLSTEMYLGITAERTLRDELLRGQSIVGDAAAVQQERLDRLKETPVIDAFPMPLAEVKLRRA